MEFWVAARGRLRGQPEKAARHPRGPALDYPGANDRLHQFVLDGMAVNRRRAAKSRATYYPYVEPSRGHGRKLLATLAADACVVVTDWYPAFFLPRMIEAAARRLRRINVRLEAVDSNGLIPLAAHGRAFTAARFYRAFVQRVLLEHVKEVPEQDPLARLRRGPRLISVPRASLNAVATSERTPADGRRHGTSSAADRSHDRAGAAARRQRRSRSVCFKRSSTPSSRAMTSAATILTPTERADSRRISTSGTCRRTRCSRR